MTLSLVDQTILDENQAALLRGLSFDLASEADALGHGMFLRATAKQSSGRLLFELGCVPALERFSACHRYEPFWMKPAAGTRLSQVPQETQSLLVRLTNGAWLLLVPLIDSLFRFSLRGRGDDSLMLVGESGDGFSPGLGGLALYVAAGDDPFELCRRGAQSVNRKLGVGRLRRDKGLPDFVDDFGWCTWDAFYQDVSEEKVLHGLSSFVKGGVSPRFIILDDGWQSVARRATGETRLTAFAPNHKFPNGLKSLVDTSKRDYSIQTFLVWHAVTGYWGGVDGESLPAYDVVEQTRQFSEGVLSHVPAHQQDWWGNVFGLVPASRIAAFYDDYHRELRAQGVDGVKVDSQAVLEGVATHQGGRVPLNLAYRRGLEGSAQKHFQGRLINCMSNAQETFYYSPDSTLIRTSIDFFPTMPETHGGHLYANSQVGVWFGEFMHPDWDMFQSAHEWGPFHAAGRAVSGGPVYVSDKVGVHDFELLKKLVCSDGSVLRCDLPGRPTLDVLCNDPTREDVLLKIWNRCGSAGFVGAFNVQIGKGGQAAPQLAGMVGPSDVPGLEGEQFVCYSHVAGTLRQLTRTERVSLSLGERGFELCTIVPVERGFAPLGLLDKFISYGALGSVTWVDARTWQGELRDGGRFGAYAERAPSRVAVDGQAADFEYDATQRRLSLSLVAGKHRLEIIW
ncbi:MAG: Sip1-related alpha-galactosidase [Polyangiaceae bacterium]